MSQYVQIENQRQIEHLYSKSYIRNYLVEALLGSVELNQKIQEGKALIEQWVNGSYYDSKQIRIASFMQDRDLVATLQDIFIITLQKQKPELFTSVVGEVASVLGMTDKGDGAKVAGELLAILADLDVYDLFRATNRGSIQLVSAFELDERITKFIEQNMYLPPMICEPTEIKTNYDSGYLTQRESMILGRGNFHNGNICLDSINKFNQIPLSLNTELLKTFSEKPKQEFTDPKKKEQWTNFVKKSYDVYRDLYRHGNRFWLTHRVDKRGRTYAQGYHCSTQGNSFRKAIVELADKELIQGVE